MRLYNAQGNPISKPIRRRAEAQLVILVSESDQGPWNPLKPADVPDWIKDQDVLGELVAGHMCMDSKKDGKWYRAEKVQAH